LSNSKYVNNMLTFVTTNRAKFTEVSRILAEYGIEVNHANVKLIEIQHEDVEYIAKMKARDAYNALSNSSNEVLVEDDALAIHALNGFPSIYASYVFKCIGNEGILRLMEGVSNRSAEFLSVIAYFNRYCNEPLTFIGRVRGRIALSIRHGTKGLAWGYDPIFIPDGYDMTYAELYDLGLKDKVSHRRIALDKFAHWYNNNKQ
jgi:XTP/dITP diphosphohydrolase